MIVQAQWLSVALRCHFYVSRAESDERKLCISNFKWSVVFCFFNCYLLVFILLLFILIILYS